MSRGSARLAALLVASFTLLGCTPVTEWRPSKTEVRSRDEIPITLVNRGLPFIALPNPDGAPPDPRTQTYAMIDTGAASAAISEQFVQSRKLEKRAEPKLELRDAHSNKLRSHWVARIDHLDLAGARFSDFDAIVDRSGTLGGPLDVMLGRPVFANVVMTIDYPRQKLSFSDEPLPELNGKDVLPLKRDNRNNLLVPMSIDGRKTWMILDTGAAGGGTPLSTSLTNTLKWKTAPVDAGNVKTWFGVERVRTGRMNGDFKLGQYVIRSPMISVAGANDNDLLGGDVLRHFVVSIDQAHDRIRFTLPSGTATSIETPAIRHIGFTVTPPDGAIVLQSPSEAAGAGLRNGDRLLSIDGVPLNRITESHLEQFERRGEPISVRVMRGNQQLVFRVPITTIVP